MSLPDEPITRAEQYLASIAGQETTLPAQPVTRMEQYLDYIAKNGSGRGSSFPPVTTADNGKVLGVVSGEWNPMQVTSVPLTIFDSIEIPATDGTNDTLADKITEAISALISASSTNPGVFTGFIGNSGMSGSEGFGTLCEEIMLGANVALRYGGTGLIKPTSFVTNNVGDVIGFISHLGGTFSNFYVNVDIFIGQQQLIITGFAMPTTMSQAFSNASGVSF